MIAGKFGRLDLSRSQSAGESSTDPSKPEVKPDDVNQKEATDHIIVKITVIYGVLISMLGIVIPLTLFLLGDSASYNKDGDYVVVFHFYVYIVALIAIGYMSIASHMMRNQGKFETFASFGQARIREGELAPAIYESAEGVNFFLRLGLVAFAIGGCLLEGFRVMQFVEMDSGFVWHCFGAKYLGLSVFRFIYYILQALVIFKYHKMVLNFHHIVVRLCLSHLIATNITTWSISVILEAVESYRHGLNSGSGGHKRAAGPDPGHAPPPTHSDNGTPSCSIYPNTLTTVAAPYLFPFLIEYSLLAAAILYGMFGKVGHKEYEEVKEIMEERHKEEARSRLKRQPVAPSHSNGSQCDKAHTGLFIGIVAFSILGIATCFFLYFKTTKASGTLTGSIHVTADITINIIAILTIVPAFYQTRKLYFTGYLESNLDQNLLTVALFGYYILLCVMVLAAMSAVNYPGLLGFWSRCISAMCIIDLIAITIQNAFIGDGLRRKAVTDEDATNKPGRSLLTFLLICNLGLWLVNTFMLKESYAFELFSDYYGRLSWIIILNCTLPLAIYYRFHVAVCLSEIWLHAYKKTSLHKIVHRDMALCGKIL